MSSNIVERYKAKKKKNIVEYSKMLETIITLDANSLWSKKQDFNAYCKGIVDYYVEHYYFDNNINRDNPIEYSNDNINSVLLAIIEYYKLLGKPDYIQSKKNETFLLSVIICTASYIDISTNIVDGNFSKVKAKFKELLQHLARTNLLKVYQNDRVSINQLFDLVKKKINEEERFFNYFKDDNCYNEYKLLTNNPPYYEVKFKYNVEGTANFDAKMVEYIDKKFIDKYLSISYDLLIILLLKENLMNKKVNNYLVSVTDSLLNKENGLKALDVPDFKNNIFIYLDLSYYGTDAAKKVARQGFKIVYKLTDGDYTQLRDLYDTEVIVSDKMEISDDDLFEMNKRNLKIINRDIVGKKLLDDDICYKEEEK